MNRRFNKKSPQQGQPPYSNSGQKEAMTSSAGNSPVQKATTVELGKAAGGLQNAKLPKEQMDNAKSREPLMRSSANVMTSQKERKQTTTSPGAGSHHKEAGSEAEAEQARISKLFNFNESSNIRSRNLSISRSGRHKMKKQQRLSVVEGEMFNSPDKNCSSDIGPTSPLSISGPATMV